METHLHQQLKLLYAPSPEQTEVRLGQYRIDAIVAGTLVEIQFGSLGAIRGKIAHLVKKHDVCVVKPLAETKYLVKRTSSQGKIISRRKSPKREQLLSIFEDLVYFVKVFPHKRLTLEVLLTEQEEHRIPPTTRRRRRKSFEVVERRLVEVKERHVLRTLADLKALLPEDLPDPFSTADLATGAGVARWQAQKIAYCLRETGAVQTVGKAVNALLYQWSPSTLSSAA